MTQKSDLLYELAWLSRPLHQEIEAAVSAMLAETTVTVRMRSVLEQLSKLGPSTVPQIAKALDIKRQYVQIMMNEVEAVGMVERSENPAHKRSTLFHLSESGAAIIRQIRDAEGKIIESFGRNLTLDEVERAHHVMEHLLTSFRTLNQRLKT
ncbi:MarR family winged helix-turn-helix transcriptional regulator [Cochlodiniinecator piscidefendens]|uniref:MarR family winged helix-turn-helix transcriptional regulator n=1 Tax=Cochlodiniinecator piscidefendens TaxID=2715756 RepID=UPI001408D84C|nr:MarR family transcriptional regulator [Cochlodiniinecator piscidefendens]